MTEVSNHMPACAVAANGFTFIASIVLLTVVQTCTLHADVIANPTLGGFALTTSCFVCMCEIEVGMLW